MPGTYVISTVDKYEQDTSLGRYNAIGKLDDSHVVVFYQGSGGCYLKIVEIDGSVNFVTPFTSSFLVTADNCNWNDLLVINENTVIVSFRNLATAALEVRTFNIDGSYVITLIDSSPQGTAGAQPIKMLMPKDNTVIVVFSLNTNDLYMRIWEMDTVTFLLTYKTIKLIDAGNNAQLGACVYDESHIVVLCGAAAVPFGGLYVLTWDPVTYVGTMLQKTDTLHAARISYCAIEHIKGDLFFSSFNYTNLFDGRVATWELDPVTWGFAPVDEITYYTSNRAYYNKLAKLNNNAFINAFRGAGNDGYASSFTFDNTADNIVNADTHEFDNVQGRWAAVVQWDTYHCIVAYEGPGSDGWIISLHIDADDPRPRRIHNIN